MSDIGNDLLLFVGHYLHTDISGILNIVQAQNTVRSVSVKLIHYPNHDANYSYGVYRSLDKALGRASRHWVLISRFSTVFIRL